MYNTRELRTVGFIVSEATSSEFFFISSQEEYPPKWEYLLVTGTEYVDDALRPVEVLAQVEKVISKSDTLTERLDVEQLERMKKAGIEEARAVGVARILGYMVEGDSGMEGRVLMPRRAMIPGNPVYIAPQELLERFFSFPEEEGLYVGNLISRPDVPVKLSVAGFRRHLAIIAQTGAGKSYCAGVLIEELLEKGASILVIDPHADYVFLSLTDEGGRYEYADRVTIFRNPASTGRYGEQDVGKLQSYEISFQNLSEDEVCDIAGILERWKNLRDAVREALERLREEKKYYQPGDLLRVMEELSEESGRKSERGYFLSAMKYIRKLNKLRVFTYQSTPIASLLKPMHVSVIDLSGLEDVSMDYITSRILEEAFTTIINGEFEYPVFVFIEEAHRFIPYSGRSTFSTPIIKRIASEGRKFGLFLILITQRPSKIHPDSLSQCNSQIIMKLTNPSDQKAVSESSERLSQDLLDDLPGLNPGEAVIVGEVTKTPVMVRVRRRKTREGGADIDIVERLKEARRTVIREASWNVEREEKFTGVFSEV